MSHLMQAEARHISALEKSRPALCGLYEITFPSLRLYEIMSPSRSPTLSSTLGTHYLDGRIQGPKKERH